jgi:Zn-dependent membrane protease YugP
MLLIVPAVLLTIYAQWKVQSTFSHYSLVGLDSRISGAEAARWLARRHRLNVAVEPVSGTLTDHYDPAQNVLRLSEPVFAGRSVAAVGVAAHELGHALQKAENYPFLAIRSGLVPLVGLGSNASWILFMIGLIAHLQPLIWLGIGLFSLAVVFSLVTLPVEFDASRRALVMLRQDGLVHSTEEEGVRQVLNAAALTYVAAALMAVLQLLRLVLLARNNER